jgi:hypothetical protein
MSASFAAKRRVSGARWIVAWVCLMTLQNFEEYRVAIKRFI